MKLKLTTALLALVSTAAFAQVSNYPDVTAVPLNKQRVTTVTQTSATAALGTDVAPFENLNIYCVGTAATTSASVQFFTIDGTQVGSSTVNCTTTGAEVVSRTSTAIGFTNVVVSPTAGLTGTNSLRSIIVRTPSVYRQ